MRIRKKLKRSTKQYLIVAIICIVVIGGAAVFTSLLITSQIKEEYEAQLKKAYQEMERNRHRVYVAIADIKAGDYITKEDIEEKLVYTSQPEETYQKVLEGGETALVDISAGTQIIHSMLTKNQVSSELRELEFNVINISSNISSNDTVDVRISYPNGESYVVLSKKIIRGISPETAVCYFWLDEEELLRMSAAIVDAVLYSGAELTITKYIEPSIQEASVVNYVPSLSILSLLESDPNIVERCSQELNKEIRKALENRLAESMELDVSEINWDIHPNKPIPPDAPLTDLSALNRQEENIHANEDIHANENIHANEDASMEVAHDPPESSPEEPVDTPDYLYYSQEELAKDGDVEFGE
ncbi:MAG TPA: hypothetical protein DIW41_11265 [Lachnospiraceae bacterium]|nr:hypothetical protein [Lachnospiraceae bacterium]